MSKICMLVTNSIRKDPRVRKEALTAYNAGHDVTVIGIKDQNFEQDFIEEVPYKIVLIESVINPYKRFTPGWFFIGVTKANSYNKKFVREVLRIRPDLIHSNDYDTLSAGYKASKKCGAKLVYDSHEIATGSILAEKYRIVKRFISRKEGKMISEASSVISVSNAAADYLSKLYDINRPNVITNCPPYFELPENISKSNSFEVLYQGIMSYGRGYEEFVRSAKYTDNHINYVIRGYGETKEELLKLAIDEGVSDRVNFPEPVEISELIIAASKSSVGVVLTKPVCLNYNMTISNKLFEYIQAEIPVVLSNVPEHVYLNNMYNIGIVINDVEPKQIAKAINTLYEDHVLYDKLRENVKRAKRILSWETFEEKLLNIYSM